MTTSDELWNDVGEQFKKLGSIFREHYEARGVREETGAPDVEDAVAKAVAGIRHAFGAVGDSATDPQLREGARVTAGSFFKALGATFTELGSEISAGRKADKESP